MAARRGSGASSPAWPRDSGRPPSRGQGLGVGLGPLGAGIDAELDLSEALARNLASILEANLADVAQALAAWLAVDPVGATPSLTVAAQANAEARAARRPTPRARPCRPAGRSAATVCLVNFMTLFLRFPSLGLVVMGSAWETGSSGFRRSQT